MTRLAATLSSSFVLGALIACGGGSSTSPADTTGNNPGGNNPGGSSNVILTLTLRAQDAAANVAGVVYTYIGDAGATRAQMPTLLNENAPTLRPIPGQQERTITVSVTKGKTVTIFVAEMGAAGFNAFASNTALNTVTPGDATEFINFSGPLQTEPEEGVATVKMDADKTVVVNFDRMRGITITARGCPLVGVTWTGPGYLGFGTRSTNAGSALASSDAILGDITNYRYAFNKSGSIYTWTAQNQDVRTAAAASTGFMTWSGGGCGSAKACTLTIPARPTAVPTSHVQNSYIVGVPDPNILGCGSCTGTDLCSQFIPRMRP